MEQDPEIAQASPELRQRYEHYIEFVSQKAEGKLATTAHWMRNFVLAHPSYALDSVVTPTINHDLLKAIHEIGLGLRQCPELTGGEWFGFTLDWGVLF